MKWEILKGSEKDFEGAPEWATMKCHCTVGDPTEIRNENVAFSDGVVRESHWVGSFEDDLEGVIHREEQWHVIAERRLITEPESVLPVSGSEMELDCGVEFYTNDGSYCFEEGTHVIVGGTVNFGLGDFLAVKVKGTNVITDVNPVFLRHIRSPEDVARDDFIKKLSGNVIEGISIGTRFAGALYDAGYRKVE